MTAPSTNMLMSLIARIKYEIRRPYVVSTSELIDSLDTSQLHQAGAAILALKSGCNIEWGKPQSAEAILAVYGRRSRYLATKCTSPHAIQLSTSCEELAREIEIRGIDAVSTVRVDHQSVGSFLIWLVPEGNITVGCLHAIGNDDVSPGEWDDLWEGE